MAVDWVDSDEDSEVDAPAAPIGGEEGDEEETAAQVRLRMSKEYLTTLRRLEEQAGEDVGAAAASGGASAGGQQFVSHGAMADTIEGRIAARLQQDVQAHTGSLFADAAAVLARQSASITANSMRGHHVSVFIVHFPSFMRCFRSHIPHKVACC